MLSVKNIRLMQEGFRHPPKEVEEMIDFVKSGGRFNKARLDLFTPDHNNKLIAITRCEDGEEFVRDGFHRVMAICLGRPDGMMYDDEYFIENLTYLRMNTPHLNMRYYTPFDPRVEVRAADFAEFKDVVEKVIAEGKDPIPFIAANRHCYVKPKLPHQETVETFAEYLLRNNHQA